MRPKASWAIDSEPIRARGMIVKYFLAKFSYNEEIRQDRRKVSIYQFLGSQTPPVFWQVLYLTQR